MKKEFDLNFKKFNAKGPIISGTVIAKGKN